MKGSASGHVVHMERLPNGGVKVWLDGVPVRALTGYELAGAVGLADTLVLAIRPREIVWGAPDPVLADPAPIVDDGLRHFARRFGRTTPSGKTACETCGETWPCSTFGRRGAFPSEVDKSSGAPLD